MSPINTLNELGEKLSTILDIIVRIEEGISVCQVPHNDDDQPPRVYLWKGFDDRTCTLMFLGKEDLIGKDFDAHLSVRGKTPARQTWSALLHSIVSTYFQDCISEPDIRENGKIVVHGKFAVMSEHEFKKATRRIGPIVSHMLLKKLGVRGCDPDKITTQINLKIKEIRNNRFDTYKIGLKGTKKGSRKRKRTDKIESDKENDSSISEDKYNQGVTSLPTTKLSKSKSETPTSTFKVLDLQDEYVDPKLDDGSKALFKFPAFKKAIGAIEIYARDVDRLEPQKNLNDSLVDMEFRQLGIENIPNDSPSSACDLVCSKIQSFPSCFYSKLVEEPSIGGEQSAKAYERVRKWTTRSKNVFEKDYIFFPIVFSGHWSLMCYVNPCSPNSYPISKSNGEIEHQSYLLYFDSMEGVHPFKEITFNIKRYLAFEWHKVFGTQSDFTRLSCINCSTFVPKQENAYDCGIFIMMYARKVIELGMKEILNDNLLLREVKEKINAHIFSLDDVDKKRLDLKRFCQRNYRSYSKNMDSSAMIRKGEYCVDTNMVRLWACIHMCMCAKQYPSTEVQNNDYYRIMNHE